jgi:ZIP family zinc transporter
LAGAVLGVLAMLGLQAGERKIGSASGLFAAAGLDVFIDGFVLGLAFLQGAKQGMLLTIALTAELLFLGLSVAAAVQRPEGTARSRATTIAMTAAIALALPAGAAVGASVGNASRDVLAGFFAFGLVALLYLVTEELLTEAHEVPDTALMPAAFFLGFIGLIYLEELM